MSPIDSLKFGNQNYFLGGNNNNIKSTGQNNYNPEQYSVTKPFGTNVSQVKNPEITPNYGTGSNGFAAELDQKFGREQVNEPSFKDQYSTYNITPEKLQQLKQTTGIQAEYTKALLKAPDLNLTA